MRPIPEHLPGDDPTWAADMLLLAVGLVEEGAKAKVIRRYTNVTKREVQHLYKSITGESAPSGPLMQGKAQFFVNANNSKHGSGPQWNLQGAIFLECYERLETCADFPLNKGWLLLNAFRAYKRITDGLHRELGVRRLDINNGYSLLALKGSRSAPEYGEVALHHCKTCNRKYLVMTSREIATQRCPLEMMSDNYKRLVQQGQQSNAFRRTIAESA